MSNSELSVVKHGNLYDNTCGYCKSGAQTSLAYGLQVEHLTVYDYQDLLDRGWRRSGTFLYKPELERSCCPQYTIRLRANDFKPSKEQNRVRWKMQRFLDGEHASGTKGDGENSLSHTHGNTSESAVVVDRDVTTTVQRAGQAKVTTREEASDADAFVRILSNALDSSIRACIEAGALPRDLEIPSAVVRKVQPKLREQLKNLVGDVQYTSSVAFQLLAALKHNESFTKGKDTTTIAELLFSKLPDSHDFKVQACKGHINFVSKDDTLPEKGIPISLHPNTNTSDVSYAQTVVEKEKRTLEIHTNRSKFDPEEYALYKKYQVKVHQDRPEDVNERSYRSFLVDTPLVYVPPSSKTPSCGLGSFHQQYIIDGKLVAVGVVDILSTCLSSKYLFWDPDFAFLSLGKFSALKEIMWVQEAGKRCPAMEFYYMGYYIHSCPKMKYKAAYSPSQLLCPVRYQWVPFGIVCSLFDNQPYVCLSDHVGKSNVDDERQSHVGEDTETRDINMVVVESSNEKGKTQASESSMSHQQQLADINTILLKIGNRLLRFKQLAAIKSIPQRYIDQLVVDLQEYLHYVGLPLAEKMAYALQ